LSLLGKKLRNAFSQISFIRKKSGGNFKTIILYYLVGDIEGTPKIMVLYLFLSEKIAQNRPKSPKNTAQRIFCQNYFTNFTVGKTVA
jgi:hypothetical protein